MVLLTTLYKFHGQKNIEFYILVFTASAHKSVSQSTLPQREGCKIRKIYGLVNYMI